VTFVVIPAILVTLGGVVPIFVDRAKGGYDQAQYYAPTLTTATELFKFTMSLILLFGSEGFFGGLELLSSMEPKLFALYFPAGFFYAGCNNLELFMMNHMDPGTYKILSRLNMLTTGLVWWIVFKKCLNRWKLLGMLFVLCGCLLYAASPYIHKEGKNRQGSDFWGFVLLGVQLCFQAGAS